jgi:hypothetical protein
MFSVAFGDSQRKLFFNSYLRRMRKMSVLRGVIAPGVMLIALSGCAATEDRALTGVEREGLTPGLVASPWAMRGEAGWEASRNDAGLGWPQQPGAERVMWITTSTKDRQYTTNGRPRDHYRTTVREREFRRIVIR